jgi:hypothetical protein
MLFKKTTVMYCENHTKGRNVVCVWGRGWGDTTEILNVKSVTGLKPISVRVKVCYSFLHKISKTIDVNEDKWWTVSPRLRFQP